MCASRLSAGRDVDGSKTVLFQLGFELFQPRRSPALLVISINASSNQIPPCNAGAMRISRTYRFQNRNHVSECKGVCSLTPVGSGWPRSERIIIKKLDCRDICTSVAEPVLMLSPFRL